MALPPDPIMMKSGFQIASLTLNHPTSTIDNSIIQKTDELEKKIQLLLMLCKFLQDLHRTISVNIMFHSQVKAQVECILLDYSSSIRFLTFDIR